MNLSIVIPMYNCESIINNVLDSISNFINKYNGKTEVICVDDGSKDNTAAVVEEYIENSNNKFNLIKKKNGG